MNACRLQEDMETGCCPREAVGALLPSQRSFRRLGSPPKTGPSDRAAVLERQAWPLGPAVLSLLPERSCTSDVQSCLGIEFGRSWGAWYEGEVLREVRKEQWGAGDREARHSGR